MTVTLDLAPDEERMLCERAAAAGVDVRTFIREAAIEKATRPGLAELLGPIHEATIRAGATVEEIDIMAERALEEVRNERRAARARQGP